MFVGIVGSCSIMPSGSRPQATHENPFRLIVSPRHRADFSVFSNPAVAPSIAAAESADNTGPQAFTDAGEIDAIFRSLARQSDAYCNALFTQNKFDAAQLELIAPDRRALFIQNRHPDSLYSLLAGCRNFFEMNDVAPNRDFALVRALYPEAGFDCYSVGLLQPYIMHATLGCRRLTMIDINWRILDFHRTLIRLTRAGAFPDASSVDDQLRGVELKFLALQNDPLRARPAKVQNLCRPLQHEYCAQILPDFQKVFTTRPPIAIELNLSTLHSGSYAPTNGADQDDDWFTETKAEHANGNAARPIVRVIYLSNAIEESYTSRAEFVQLLENLQRSALAQDQSQEQIDVLIHHVGGWKLFGIYELQHAARQPETRDAAPATLRTVCKDSYLSNSRGDGSGPVEYTTHFEAARSGEFTQTTNAVIVSKITNVPTCAQLLQAQSSR